MTTDAQNRILDLVWSNRANLFLALAGSLSGEIEKDLTLGIESVTGLRSSYLYRGFEVADTTLDFQIESEIALGQDNFLSIAAWHAAESSADFSESALSLDLHHDIDDFRLSASLAYHDFTGTFLESGVNFGLGIQWFIDRNWNLNIETYYDFGAKGYYTSLEAGWTHPFTEDLYLSAKAGMGTTIDYYGSSGGHDLHGRLSLTYNVNSFLSITPFAGLSLGLNDLLEDQAYAGLWLAVSF